jgi:phosphatidate phosphatase APP1
MLDIAPQTGTVDVIEPTGISIISDIDDTIKKTDILDGRDMILQNTFFRKAKEIPGMSNVYQSWSAEGVKFHYVSNSPWQVYPALQEFLKDNHFPKGSIHLRMVSTQSLILGKPGKHKWDTITTILEVRFIGK